MPFSCYNPIVKGGEMLIYILSFIIIFFAAMIQGVTSFGFSLIAVPLLALLMPLDIIVPMLVLFSLILNILVYSKIDGHINKKQIAILIFCGLISIPIGIYGLSVVDDKIIKLVVGLIIVVSALAMQFGFKVTFKRQNIAYGLTGFLSGILNGASSLSGPPVILLLSNEGADKNNFRKTLATYFMTLNLFSIPMFLLSGFLTGEVMLDSIKLFPALLVGTLLGIKLGDKIPDGIFRKITLVLIFVMGVLTLISGI